jgi:L-alanine-DL-glutamate epimerase-like enolase superfamily enzyme
VNAEIWRIPFSGEVSQAWSPGSRWREVRTTVFKVSTDAGIVGYGASTGSPAIAKEQLAPKLIGQDPFAVPQLYRAMRNSGGTHGQLSTICGIELALWDIVGKAANQPLYKLWGSCRDEVKAYASLVEVRTPDQRAEDVLRLYDEGYRAVKLRLHAPTMKEDVAQVEAVRRVIGDRMEIMVDANQAQEPGTPGSETDLVWGYARALATARELAQLDVAWIEEPLPRFDFEHIARLTAESQVPIAGGENNIGLHEFRLMLDRGCYEVIQPDALVSGGLHELRMMASYAAMHHKQFAPHHGGNGIGIAAHMHLTASVPNSHYVELLQDPPGMLLSDFQGIIQQPFRPNSNGMVPLPDAPGLGIELNERWEQVG